MTFREQALPILKNAPHLPNSELVKIFRQKYKNKSTDSSLERNFRKLREYEGIEKPKPKIKEAKIFVFDIETTHMKVRTWQNNIWNANIQPKDVVEDWIILSWVGKWLYDTEIVGEILTPKEAKKRDDKRIVKALWKYFDEADIIIAHNGLKFDIPNCNTRFLYHKMKPPSPYRVVDTLRMAKKTFKHTYNRLDYLGERLGIGRKIKVDDELWVECENGNEQALKKMLEYNKKDVILLEDVYTELRGWMHSHPNMNVFQETEDCCSNCGSTEIVRKGTYTTNTNSFASYQCKVCGAFSRQASKRKISTAR